MHALHPDQPACRFLHDWLELRSGTSLRVWSVFAGDGAEARSIATLCDEYGVDADVVGTAPDAEQVARANGEGFRGSARVAFREGPTVGALDELGTFDLISVRGATDAEQRAAVLAEIESLLRDGGLLVVSDDEVADARGSILARS